MPEIEVKVLEVKREEVLSRLLPLGARCDFDGEMHALYYDTPDRRLFSRRDALRLRSEGGKTILNYKVRAKGGDMKINEEMETEVGDLETVHRIFLGLGYEVWLEMRKKRLSYLVESLPGVHFVFDRYLGEHAFVPELLEVEAPTPELLRQGVAVAGFTMAATVPWNAFQLFEHYRGGRPGKEGT